jgi:hypothetical protein
MTCERTGPQGAHLGERTRINARRSVIRLPLQAYALGWSMRVLDSFSVELRIADIAGESPERKWRQRW